MPVITKRPEVSGGGSSTVGSEKGDLLTKESNVAKSLAIPNEATTKMAAAIFTPSADAEI